MSSEIEDRENKLKALESMIYYIKKMEECDVDSTDCERLNYMKDYNYFKEQFDNARFKYYEYIDENNVDDAIDKMVDFTQALENIEYEIAKCKNQIKRLKKCKKELIKEFKNE